MKLSALAAELESRARAAETLAELGFSMANDSYAALPFRQALVFAADGRLLTVSGLAKAGEDSPYLLWLKRAWPWVAAHLPHPPEGGGGWFAPDAATLAGAPEEVAEGWREWWPAGLFDFKARQGQLGEGVKSEIIPLYQCVRIVFWGEDMDSGSSFKLP